MTPEEKELRNNMAPILEQMDAMSEAEREELFTSLPEWQSTIVRNLWDERTYVSAIGETLNATLDGPKMEKIAFADPDNPEEDYAIDLETGEYS